MMSKKDFIALADVLRPYLEESDDRDVGMDDFANVPVGVLADFCASLNPRFMRDRWLGYLRGECGPGGGKRTK